jgi:hypothetical protein
MSSIIGSIRDFFSGSKSKLSTIQYSELQSLSLNNVPLITYVLIGTTTVILASYTIIDSGNKEEGEDDSDESMLDSLPSTEGIKETLANMSPFKSSTEEEPTVESPLPEEEDNKIVGGRKKHKKSRTHKNLSNTNKKSHKK